MYNSSPTPESRPCHRVGLFVGFLSPESRQYPPAKYRTLPSFLSLVYHLKLDMEHTANERFSDHGLYENGFLCATMSPKNHLKGRLATLFRLLRSVSFYSETQPVHCSKLTVPCRNTQRHRGFRGEVKSRSRRESGKLHAFM